LTINFPLICQIRDISSGQILQPRQFHLSPGFKMLYDFDIWQILLQGKSGYSDQMNKIIIKDVKNIK